MRFKYAGHGETDKKQPEHIFLHWHLFCFLIVFPSCAVVPSEFRCLTHLPLLQYEKHLSLFLTLLVSDSQFFTLTLSPTLSFDFFFIIHFMRNVCGFCFVGFCFFFPLFIRIEFEFYLLRKING